MMMTYAAVAIGGALGACARYGLSTVFKGTAATLIANGVGCFLNRYQNQECNKTEFYIWKETDKDFPRQQGYSPCNTDTID